MAKPAKTVSQDVTDAPAPDEQGTDAVQTPNPAPAANEPAPAATPEKTKQMSFSLLDDGQIRADFDGLDPLFINPAMIPENLIPFTVAEGITSRARGYTSKLQGDSRTPAALRESIAKAFENLLAGIWKIERAGTPGESYTQEVLAAYKFRQMRAEATGQDPASIGTLAEAAIQFNALTDEQKATLKKNTRYQQALASVKAEASAAKAAKLAKKAADEDDGGF